MSAVYADPTAAAPALGEVGVPARADDEQRLLLRVRTAAALPAVICIGVHLIFLVTYWIPETSAVPAHDWWLTQLAPLVSEAVTSAGAAQVPAQQTAVDVAGELLLVAAVALLLLARHPRRLGQSAVLVPAALGTVVAVVLLLALLASGQASTCGLTVLLVLVWVAAAAYASVFSLLLDLGPTRPRRWRNGLPLLAVYAVVGPAPVAVGRALFGRTLREAAASLEGNGVALRLSALTSGSTVLLYLAGLGVGAVVWAAYQCWPPRWDLGMLVRVGALALAVVLTAGLGGAATVSARHRAEQLRTESPAKAVHFGCGTAELAPLARTTDPAPARTLVVTGLGCRSITTFEGYRQLATRRLDFSAAPVSVQTPDGRRLNGRVVSAQYDDVFVVVGSTRIDTRVDRVAAVRVSDGELLWQYACSARQDLRVRFARVPGGDNPPLGYITKSTRIPQVVTVCGGRMQRWDPRTGRDPDALSRSDHRPRGLVDGSRWRGLRVGAGRPPPAASPAR